MPIYLSAVSYLNTRPFLFGLKQADLSELEVSVDIPSICAEKLQTGKADIGLVPVAAIPILSSATILPGWCIGANGAVESVILYSEVPLTEIKTILLDYQSRTSVILAQILAKEKWKIQPEWKRAEPGFENAIANQIAGIVIGDRTFSMSKRFKYSYDLAAEWKLLTGLPFVFAAWVCTRSLPESFLRSFSAALADGIAHLEDVIRDETPRYAPFDVRHYLTNCISYSFTTEKQEGLALFYKKMKQLKPLAQ
jgi:chorismate dehydratase